MQPRLAAISGKLKGGIFIIDGESLVIGRETAANLCIADVSVSRRHSIIENKGGNAFVISDLDSLNGTFVNDVPVKTRQLEHVALCRNDNGGSTTPTNAVWAAFPDATFYGSPPASAMNPAALGQSGGSQPHDNMMPYLCISFIISLFGFFPHLKGQPQWQPRLFLK